MRRMIMIATAVAARTGADGRLAHAQPVPATLMTPGQGIPPLMQQMHRQMMQSMSAPNAGARGNPTPGVVTPDLHDHTPATPDAAPVPLAPSPRP